MKTVMILQSFGIGDVCWSQSIAHHFIQQGYHVLWPVKPHYVEACQKAYPKICFISDAAVRQDLFDIKEKIEYDGMMIAPIRWSDSYMKLPYKDVMKSKYLMYELDWQTWRLHAMWQRDKKKEKELMGVLGISPKVKYNLINKRFGTNAERVVEINVNNDCFNIEMTDIKGFSLFDWAMVFQFATEIHTVSTSIVYMLELLPLIGRAVHLYIRKPIEQNFSFVDFLFTKNYILHQ